MSTSASSPSIAWGGKFNGAISWGEAPSFYVSCAGTICNYGLASALELKGGSTAQVVAAEESLVRLGGLCPLEAKLSATYTISSPTPLYVSHT